MAVPASLSAQYGMTAPQMPQYDCVHCSYNYYNYYGPRPYVPIYNQYQYYPWWNQYGMMRYNNWNYPGMWHYPGNYPRYPQYPGNGDMIAMKPNVYVSGKTGQEFDLKIEFLGESNLLIASPSISSGWKGKISAKNKLTVGGVDYRYLYYDYRFNGKDLQMEAGFCGQKAEVVNQMAGVLEKLRFAKSEIKDFLDHWPVKMPSSPYYCVFPQETKQLQSAVKLSVEGDHVLTQMNFLVVPKEVMKRELASTIKPWLPGNDLVKLDSSKIQVREWGVTFGGKP